MKTNIKIDLVFFMVLTLSMLFVNSCDILTSEKKKDNTGLIVGIALAGSAGSSNMTYCDYSTLGFCMEQTSNSDCGTASKVAKCPTGEVGKCAISGISTTYFYSPIYTTVTAQNACTLSAGTYIPGTGTAPSSLTYTGSPYTFAKGTAITTQTPTVVGTITSCTSSPTLPAGLSISNTTCAISGAPTATQVATSYTITAINSIGSTTATISIAVDVTPTIVYTGSPYTFAKGTAITTQTPTVAGTLTSCTSSPALPAGLAISNTTCAISGTPTVNQATTSYTITTSNAVGSSTAIISIAIGFTLTLSLEHSSATGANKFLAILVSSGQKVGGLAHTTTLTTSKTYSGNFKAIDASGLTSTDITLDNGTYTFAVYADTDGSNTVNLAGDKIYVGNVTVNGSNTTVTVTNTNMGTPIDVDIQYTGGAFTASNGKNVICVGYAPGIATTITNLATFNSANAHGIAVAGSVINGGSFSGAYKATITNYLSAAGNTWVTTVKSIFVASITGDIACFIDSNANNAPDAGEPFFKASNVNTGTTIIVTSSGNL